jgi:hypothetical protein
MSVRETLQRQKGFGLAAAVLMIVVAAVAIAAQMRSDRPAGDPTKAFYSDDDGQTFFIDSADRIPPFDRNGKPAARAYVYADGGKRQFVGFLQRFKPDTARVLRATADDVAAGRVPHDRLEGMLASSDMRHAGSEIKLPGAGNKWMSGDQFNTKMVKAPDGSEPTLVVP